MGKFLGTYNRSLDSKMRLQIPSKLVKELPERFYAVRGFDGCFSVFLEDGLNRLLDKLEGMDFFGKKERDLIREISSSAKEMEVDSHGRITIDHDLAEKYRIGQEVTVIGVIDHFEVWDRGRYEEYKAAAESGFELEAEELASKNG